MIQKKFQIKVYKMDGTFIRTLSPVIIANDPSFSSEVNSGFGENTFTLKLPFDDFDEGDSINYENIVEVYEFDADNVGGRLIYKGVMTGYEPTAELGTQYVKPVLLGLGTFLTRDYFMNGASYTVDYGVATGSAADPKDMIEDIIDQVLTVYPHCGLHYNSSIVALGTTIAKQFVERTWLQSLEDAFALYGDGYFWRIEADGLVTVAAKPGSATHTFEFRKNVDEAKIEKTTESMVNSVRVKYTGGTYDHSDATSIATYGKRHAIVSATDVNNPTAAQKYAEQYVGERKDPKLAARLTVNSKYDIETIKAGQTCKVLGFKAGNNPFDSNMKIVRVSYKADKAEIVLEEMRANFGNEIQNLIS